MTDTTAEDRLATADASGTAATPGAGASADVAAEALDARAGAPDVDGTGVDDQEVEDTEAEDTEAEAADDDDGSPIVPGTGRRALRWPQVLVAGLVCFGLWLMLDASTLLRSAQASPFGTRRSVAVAILRPLASADRALGLSHVVSGANRALGRTGNGVVQLSRSVPGSHPAHNVTRQHPQAATGSNTGGPALGPDRLPQLPAPTTASPLHVLAVGDSLGVDLGDPLVNDLVVTGVVDAAADAHIDTGLARPDYFDWPAALHDDLALYSPQVVVVFMGANDPQNMVVNGNAVAFGTSAWAVDYGQRVDAFVKEATDTGAHVILVGMPPMADQALTAKMQVLNQEFALAARRPGVTYFASWSVLADPSGSFQTYLPDASGNEVQVREPDGTHITPAGAHRLAHAIIAEMDRALGLHLQS